VTIRTDKPEAEVGLYDGEDLLQHEAWLAHRQLAETIHSKLHQLLEDAHKGWQDIEGIIVFQGPGSFTGLRIGLTVANTMAQALDVPIVGCTGDNWQKQGLSRIKDGEDGRVIAPDYGAPVHITPQKK